MTRRGMPGGRRSPSRSLTFCRPRPARGGSSGRTGTTGADSRRPRSPSPTGFVGSSSAVPGSCPGTRCGACSRTQGGAPPAARLCPSPPPDPTVPWCGRNGHGSGRWFPGRSPRGPDGRDCHGSRWGLFPRSKSIRCLDRFVSTLTWTENPGSASGVSGTFRPSRVGAGANGSRRPYSGGDGRDLDLAGRCRSCCHRWW